MSMHPKQTSNIQIVAEDKPGRQITNIIHNSERNRKKTRNENEENGQFEGNKRKYDKRKG